MINIIFEVGLIKSGIALFTRTYIEQNRLEKDAHLFGALLSALNILATEVFPEEEPEAFTMKNYKLVVLNQNIKNTKDENIIAYCIASRNMRLKTAKNYLNQTISKFLQQFGNLKKYSGNLTRYEAFNEKIDKIFQNYIDTPEERLNVAFSD